MAKSNSQLINVLRQKDKITEKGMVTNSTSLNSCLDMFFMAGAARHWTKQERINIFQKAITENPLIAMKILFWVRDIREGSGERDFFRDCTDFLRNNYKDLLLKNLEIIPEFGRWDDLSRLLSNLNENDEIDEKILNYIKNILTN